MLTYMDTKHKTIETIDRATMLMSVTMDHESNRVLLRSIIEAAKLGLWLEDMQEAYEKGDLEGMRAAPINNGFNLNKESR